MSTAIGSGRSGSPSQSDDGLNKADVELIFVTFSRRFAHRWEKVFGSKEARAVWLYDLRKLGVSRTQIRVGLERSAVIEWPPTPAEFAKLSMIRPEDVGAPDVDDAFREAVTGAYPARRHRWSHKAVYHAAVRTGLSDLLEQRGDKVRAEFEREYARALQCLDQLADAPAAMIEHKRGPMTDEEFERGLDQIQNLKKILGGGQ